MVIPPSPTYWDITDVFPDASIAPQDPSGESLAARTSAGSSYAWTCELHNIGLGGAQSAPELLVVEGEEATDRNNYFQVRVVKTDAWAALDNQPAELRAFHRPIVAQGSYYYVVMADLIGASAIVPVNVSPSIFYWTVGFQMYNSGWFLINSSGNQILRSGGNPDTGGYGIAAGGGGGGGTYDPAVVYSQSLTIPVSETKNGDPLSRGTATIYGLVPSQCAYIVPFVTLRFNVVSTSTTVPTSLIQNATTLEYRFDNMRVLPAVGQSGTITKLNSIDFPNYGASNRFWQQRLYSDTDPTYATLTTNEPYDIYGQMTVQTPSIGDRIDRECFVEQIRCDVRPGEDSWKMSLGLSDAITGGYWALDSSRLDVDTRLGI